MDQLKEKNRCPYCGSIIDKREIVMFRELVVALWKVYKWVQERPASVEKPHEFQMKEIRHLLTRNAYARFGDWVMFGGLVYKKKKASYGLNIERCRNFFLNREAIPTRIWKDPITGELEKENYKVARQIPHLVEYLDSDNLYQAAYKPRPEPAQAALL